MKRAILALILIGMLITPVLADDGQPIEGSGWTGIMESNGIDFFTIGLNALYPWLSWLTPGQSGAVSGVMMQQIDGDPAIANITWEGGYPTSVFSGGLFDFIGPGEWDWDITLLNGETHYLQIYKEDHIFAGFGSSFINITEYGSGVWFNTTMSQPRIEMVSAEAFLFSISYNQNLTKFGLVIRDEDRYLKAFDMINPDQNPIVAMRFDGPDRVHGTLGLVTYPGLTNATQGAINPGQDIVTKITEIGQGLWSVLLTMWALFDWLVLKAGIILVILLVETGMMAYYSTTSKNVFQFYTKMIRGNRALFEFISGFANALFQIAVNIKNTIPFLKYI